MLSNFHPLVSRWFQETLGEPTLAQAKGWAAIREGRHTLIAAPTGSGKTLAAFLTALDDLVTEGLRGPLPDEVRVIYVSPLKALSADIHKNLAEPRRGIRHLGEQTGISVPRITAAVRSGDTTQKDRAAMLRTPPHILVTTPESLYLLLTAERSREMLRTARTVIIDEIHAVIGTRRGAHLALTLERLEQVVTGPLVRLGLSATQRPIQDVARFLVGLRPTTQNLPKRGPPSRPEAASARSRRSSRDFDARAEAEQSPLSPLDAARGDPEPVEGSQFLLSEDRTCAIVDEGHQRPMDLAIEVPRSPLEAVMSHEVWTEYYERLTALIGEHKTTLVFVNTRRMAERLARELSDRLGKEVVTAHHGSLSKEKRLDAESRLKAGQLKALIATASLELGIDIGSVDLVCQIGSPHRIATFLQRVGRSGHSVGGVAKGRLLPISRDDLVECAALLRSVKTGELDRIVSHDAPLDVLAQQIVAESACREYEETALYDLVRRAWPYRALARSDFDAVVKMTADGFATKRGRRSALVHRDEVNGKVRARRGARMLAITSGGAIPEVADYRVLLEPEDTFIGTLNEDFAIESMAGDIFQLGNASWQVLQVGAGFVRVADAKGAPPNIPFWLGEAPGRSDELSRAVSDLRAEIDQADGGSKDPPLQGIDSAAAEQIVNYLSDAKRALGVMPTQQTLVLERFFDESGGMQLVLHAPFGSRINKAWGLALRKRFCRQFNFELQAAATEDGLLLSLGPHHSFPLADVFRYLHPATAHDILVQAFLDAPVFKTRWRWNTNLSLAVPRNRGGKKVAPQLQRMLADDLMAAVFPDAAACLENIPGDREIPDHPLVNQTVRDCLQEAMDFEGLAAVLERIHRGELQLVARDTPEPSPLAHELLNARPYAFLDDAPLEERRAHAVYARRATEPGSSDFGALDPEAIARVGDEARPDPRDLDELHDALLTAGLLSDDDVSAPAELFARLAESGRATRVTLPGAGEQWVSAERLPEIKAIHPDAPIHPSVTPPTSRASRTWTGEEALVEIVRGRMTVVGPTTAQQIATSLAVEPDAIDAALLALESEGVVLRGRFTGISNPEWCDRRLLARIHRYTLNRLRAEIEAVSPADFTRFLFAWQHVDPASRLSGIDGVRALVQVFDGYELAASAWERAVFPARMDKYDASMLDMLCLTGQLGWARLSRGPAALVGATPIALFLREHLDAWIAIRDEGWGQAVRTVAYAGESSDVRNGTHGLTPDAVRVAETLHARGALFFNELCAACELAPDAAARAIGELVAAGLITSDGFAGLRALIADGVPAHAAGRWSDLRPSPISTDDALERQAWTLLRRYGVVFRRVLARETNVAPWRVLARVYRRLELRGEIRGGRFVSGMSGEQFALPDAVTRLREIRRTPPDGRLNVISAADPLNLAGIVTAGDRVRAVTGTRIVYRDGVPLAALEGDYMKQLAPIDAALAGKVASALAGRPVPPVISGYIGRTG